MGTVKTGRYTNSLTNYHRRNTVVVHVGNVPMGNDNPIRLQSMANTDTCQVAESVSQCIQLIKAGAHYVRFTVPSSKDVACLKQIRQRLTEAGYDTPLIADVHFNADIAMDAAGIVEKVRINPGNYRKRDKNHYLETFADEENDDTGYTQDAFRKLLMHCRHNKVALRVGVNHGSLSSRIIRKYGDTPLGMAESAMEFLRICKKEDFDQVVVSMKSSNIIVMVQATRLVVSKMDAEDMHYPVHLGVTEAGEGESGRVKSAAGIGALLADGIGDTIRVSLTEDPVAEIPVAKRLVEHVNTLKSHHKLAELNQYFVNPYEYHKRPAHTAANIGGKNVPVVIGESDPDILLDEKNLADFGWHYGSNGGWTFDDQSADYIVARKSDVKKQIPATRSIIIPSDEWENQRSDNTRPIYTAKQYLIDKEVTEDLHFIMAVQRDINRRFINRIKTDRTAVLVYLCSNENVMAEVRILFALLHNLNCEVPVVIRKDYHENDIEDLLVKSAFDIGGTLVDGLGNGLWLSNTGNIARNNIISLSFDILQACRMRMSRTEYIACPSCGRTHFNIIKTLDEIRKRTSHLKGMKIGVMGCIVNGPGEMADADYGYVGSGKGKITLYRSKEMIKRSVPEACAVEELIKLIKESGDWTER